MLSPDLVDRVLARLGFARPPEPTVISLASVYAAWCEKVPFDNVRKLIHVREGADGPLPGDDPRDFFEAWLAWGAGGTCWAGNGALHALLVALGFRATRGIGTMLVSPNAVPNHGTVLVASEGNRYLVDASMLHGAPLRLDAKSSTEIAHPAWGVRSFWREGRCHVRWRPLHMPNDLECSMYRLEQFDAPASAFTGLHERTRAWSPFNYELYVRRNRGREVLGLARGKHVRFDATGRFHRQPIDGRERLRALVEDFGVSEELVCRLPPDWPTPPPPGSRKAARLASLERHAAA